MKADRNKLEDENEKRNEKNKKLYFLGNGKSLRRPEGPQISFKG
jgi:hypothetical protein